MKQNRTLLHHFWIAIVLSGLMINLRMLLAFVPNTHTQPFGIWFTTMLVVYSLYLMFIVMIYFTQSFEQWAKHQDWIVGILKAYGCLFLFGLLFPFLLPGWYVKELIEVFNQSHKITQALWITVMQFFMLGLSLAFPVGLYSLYLSIKAMVMTQRKHQTYFYGTILFVVSGIVLWKSYQPFLFALQLLFAVG